jgi:hypothetical protein
MKSVSRKYGEFINIQYIQQEQDKGDPERLARPEQSSK